VDNNIDDSEVAAGPRLLACVADIETGQAARDLAAAQGWRNPVILDGGLGSAQSYIEKSAPPNLLIVDIDDSADPAKALAAVAEFCPPETSVIAIGSRNELTLYRELLDLGVTDYLTKPVSLAILERALRQEKRPGGGVGPRQQAQLVAFTGARGGVGCTTVAGSVAWFFAWPISIRSAWHSSISISITAIWRCPSISCRRPACARRSNTRCASTAACWARRCCRRARGLRC
jgi:CheY-like chemotaxis protein